MKKPKKVSPQPSKKSRKYLLIIAILAVIVIAAAAVVLFRSTATDVNANTSFQSAGALYSKSVDLANAGQYQQALDVSDQALALNATSLIPLIQANRAGILVMLGENTEAIDAANVAIAAQGNLTTTWSVAWFNKGNALRNLGRTDEARAAYANASALDPTLPVPKI